MPNKTVLFTFSLVLVFAIVLTSCGQKETSNSPLFAKLSELRGKVGIQEPGADQFNDATTESVLQENGQVQTGADGRVRLDLSTGTIIRISPTTLFQLTANEETEEGLATRLQLEAGRIFIILKGGSMDVDTPSGVASVRGSYMMVEVDPETLDVVITCLEGQCSAGNPAGELDFTDGQKTILLHRDPVTGQYMAPELGLMTPEDFQKWLDENPEAADLFNQAMSTLTAMAPTQEPTEEATEEPTAEPTTEIAPVIPPPSGDSCVKLVYPPQGSNFSASGAVTFEWESQVQAVKYILTFRYPNGLVVQFETTETNLTRYFESMPAGGGYSWDITAVNESGQEICKSDTSSFEKPAPEPTKKKEKPEPTEPPTPKPTQKPYNPFCDPNSSWYDIELCQYYPPPTCPPSDPSYPWCYPPTQPPQ